jgi:hypothetical protein
MKEQISVTTATIELTEEELASMHGGCHDDCDWRGDDCDDRRDWRRDDCDFGYDDRSCYRGYNYRCDW